MIIKMNMKRIISMFLAFVMVISLLTAAPDTASATTTTNATHCDAQPIPTISQEGGIFETETLTLNIGLENATSGTYQIGDGKTITYTSSTEVLIGADMASGDSVTVLLTATDGTNSTYKVYVFKKTEKLWNVAYLDIPEGWSTPVYCYAYDEELGVENAPWPGEEMTMDSFREYYMYEIPDNIVTPRVIFSSLNGNRYPSATEGGVLCAGQWIYNGTTWEDCHVEPVGGFEPPFEHGVYFANSIGWENVHIYYWSSSNPNMIEWPGVPLEEVWHCIYGFELEEDTDIEYIIFNNGSNEKQTKDLELVMNGRYDESGLEYVEDVIGRVIVEYVDEFGNDIVEWHCKTGTVGTAYTTAPAVIDGYELIEMPSNANGMYTMAGTRVTYVYSENKVGFPLDGILTADDSTETITKTVGDFVTLKATGVEGAGDYEYKFAVLNIDTGIWTVLQDYSNNSSYTFALNYKGVKQFAVTVKDREGATVATNRVTVTVEDNSTPLSASLQVNGSTSSVTQTVGSTIKLDAVAVGGSGSYTYKFAVLNVETGNWFVLKDFDSSSTYTSALSVAGAKQFAVTVKDSTGKTVATNRISVTAVENESNLSASLLVNGSTEEITQMVGSYVTLNAKASGGSGNYTYKFAVYNETTGMWFVLKDFSSSSTYTSPLSVAGAKQFAVTVKDSTGKTVATNRIRVTAAENSKSVINFTSNVSDTVKYEYNNDDNQVTVTYYLQSDYAIVDTQAIISYDNTVLSIADINTPSSAIPSFTNGGILNFYSAKGIMFCATNLNLYDFTTEAVYFTVTFDIIGSGNTTVNLEMEYLSATKGTTLEEVLDSANDVQIVDYSEVLKSDSFTCRVETSFKK